MRWIQNNIRWIMILSGGLTTTMLYAAIAPDAAMRSMFGESVDGPLAHILARNWGMLIALTGAMLIYGAFDRPSRPLVLAVASISKTFFIVLVLAQGARYLGQQTAISVIVDSAMVVLFVWYLASSRQSTGETRKYAAAPGEHFAGTRK